MHTVDIQISEYCSKCMPNYIVSRSYTDSSVDNSCFGQFSIGRFGSRASGRFVKGGKS